MFEKTDVNGEYLAVFQDQKVSGDQLCFIFMNLSDFTIFNQYHSVTDMVPISMRTFISSSKDKILIFGYDGTKVYKSVVSIRIINP